MKTIKDIAKEANVSTGTVDRVLHDRPGVSPKTKEKIQKLLDKYGFQKNVLASALALKKKYTIATLIPKTDKDKEFWKEPDNGIQRASAEMKKYGFEILCFYFDKFKVDSFSHAFDKILELNPNGVVMAPIFYNTSIRYTKKLEERNIPFVLINIEIKPLNNLSFIGQDGIKSGILAGKLLNLILNEEDHILIIKAIKNVDNHNAIDMRINGFMDYFKQKGITKHIKEIPIEDFNDNVIKKALTQELIKDNLIKGIFVPSSMVFTVAKFLDSVGLKRIRLLGFDSHPKSLEFVNKEVIDFLIDQNPFEQGYLGLKILFEYLFFNKIPNKNFFSSMDIITKENVEYFRRDDVSEYVI
ncbi:substrate-binding domain-containing protein [Flavobacteriaceae bacterium MHTCC 0001]